MAKDNIILVGFMGTGKTAVGKRLASMLDKRFLDADKEIEKLTGMTLMRLYHKHGPIRFQSEEDLMLRKLLKEHNSVIATGGTLSLTEERYDILSRSGIVICLTADPQVISERVKRRNNRPLLHKNNLYQDIITLIKEREALPNRADLIVDTSHRSFDEIMQIILDYLQTHEEDHEDQ